MNGQHRQGGPLADAWAAAFMAFPIPAVKVAEGCPVLIWAELRCGACGREFTADPKTVPMFGTADAGKYGICRSCWDRRNALRVMLGDPLTARPLCYPEDYPPEI